MGLRKAYGPRATYADMFTHLPDLAVAERDSLVSIIFTDPGKQVLVVKPGVAKSVAYEGLPPLVDKVVRGEPDPIATDPTDGRPDYYRDWRHDYDYLYVLFAFPGAPPPAPDLSLVYQGRTFQLYRVAPPHAP